MDALTMATMAIGSMALLPVAAIAIGGILRSRRERRRAAMLSRYADRIGY